MGEGLPIRAPVRLLARGVNMYVLGVDMGAFSLGVRLIGSHKPESDLGLGSTNEDNTMTSGMVAHASREINAHGLRVSYSMKTKLATMGDQQTPKIK